MTGPREPSPPSWGDDPTQPYVPTGSAGRVPPPDHGRPPPPPGYGPPQAPPTYGQPPPPGPPPWYGQWDQGPPGGLPPVRAPQPIPGRSPFPMIALVLVVVLLAAAGGWYFVIRPSGDAGPGASPSKGVAAASPTPRAPRRTPANTQGGAPTAVPAASPTPAASEPGTATQSPVESIPPATPGGSAGPGASIDPSVVAQIDQVIAQVPGIRGLQPKKDVPYRFITQDQFAALFQKQFEKDNPPKLLAGEQNFDTRVGLLPAGSNLKDLILKLYASQVAAFYDPDTQQFTVVEHGSAFGPSDQVTVAHEYDHALQDQYWHLAATDIKDPTQGDAAAANLALVEGDATALMFQWAVANLTPDQLSQVGTDPAAAASQQVLDGMPLLLRQELTFPYFNGLDFVSTLQASGSGGWAEVNKAWDQRPKSTEQIMHPEKYLAGEAPISVTLPDVAAHLGKGWNASYTQTLGELDTGIWLADGQGGGSAGSGLPAPLPNAEAAAGWGGDRLVSLDGPNGAWAVVWQTAWDTPTDADEFATAADAVMADLPGVHSVVKTSIAGALNAPVLVVVAGDQQTLDAVRLAIPSG